VLAAVEGAAADANRYPRQMADELTAAIALFHGVETGGVAVGAGAIALLGYALAAFVEPGDQVIYGWRSFEAYPILAGVAGAEAVGVPLTDTGQLDLGSMSAAITPTTRAILVCSPNNPTGPAVRRDEFDRFMAVVPTDVLVVLDEAYVDFVTDSAAVNSFEALGRYSNLLTMRTFSKAYGLAGLRVGYAVGRPRLIEAIRAVARPFEVSAMAELAAIYSLQMQEAMAQRVRQVVETRTVTFQDLVAQGWRVPEPQGNFVWLELGADAVPFAGACQRAGLLVRPFPGEGVRVSIGEPVAAERFLEVAATWV
jgi:histidinol-phosphate aminotransferase